MKNKDKTKIKDGNFIMIQSFMLSKMNLKGNELLIYAIIYGFSQDGESKFTGSLQYLSEWSNTTKQGVLKTLKSLQEKKYIGKIETVKNGVKFCEYYATKLNEVLNKVEHPIQQSLTDGIKQSLPNIISLDTIEENIEESIDLQNQKKFEKWTLQDFENELSKFKGKYSNETLLAFYNHWSEMSSNGKMKFQLKETWETAKRLSTWKSLEKKFNAPSGKKPTENDVMDAAQRAIYNIYNS